MAPWELDNRLMVEREKMARLRDEANRDEFAVRRIERTLAAQERELERKMKAFQEGEEAAERQIEAEWQREHWGLKPERPPAWREHSFHSAPD